MHRTKTAFFTGGAALAIVLAALVGFLAFAAGSDSVSAAGTPTITPDIKTPTPTVAKPADDGNLSGISDLQVYDTANVCNSESLASLVDTCDPQGECEDGVDNDGDTLVDLGADPQCGGKAQFAFFCKSRTDHEDATDDVKISAMCYAGAFFGLSGDVDPNPVNPDLDALGPPDPPPPYNNALPSKGEGSYDSGSDTLTVTTCFENAGGPHIVAVATFPDAKATTPNLTGTTEIHRAQGTNECDSLTPSGDPFLTLGINSTQYDTPPYSVASSVDSDGDTCPDAFELDKTRSEKDCGKDPYNPLDSDLNFDGPVSIGVEATPIDVCKGPDSPRAGTPPLGCTEEETNGGGAVTCGDTIDNDGDGDTDGDDSDCNAAGRLARGSFFNCVANLDHDKTNNKIDGAAWCYTDNPLTTINPEAAYNPDNIEDGAGPGSCEDGNDNGDFDGADADDPDCHGGRMICALNSSLPPDPSCGNGNPGGGPRFAFAKGRAADNDSNTVHAGGLGGNAVFLAGWLYKDLNVLVFDACFPSDNFVVAPGGFVYARVTLDAHTGVGHADLWQEPTTTDCSKPQIDPTQENLPVVMTEQQPDWDTDQDGCTTAHELSGAAAGQGGARDPMHYGDHPDVTDPDGGLPDGSITLDDILAGAEKFGGVSPGTYGDAAGPLTGSTAGAHAKGPPDGDINLDDILNIAEQFGHDCP